MPDQIQVRWSSFSKKPYEESLTALKQFSPPPATKLTITVKEALPLEAISRVQAICKRRGATLTTKEKVAGMLPADGITQLGDLLSSHELQLHTAFKVEGENLSTATINQIKSIADQYEATVDVLLTATQAGEGARQLQLFAPPKVTQEPQANAEDTGNNEDAGNGEGTGVEEANTGDTGTDSRPIDESPNGMPEHTPNPNFAEATVN